MSNNYDQEQNLNVKIRPIMGLKFIWSSNMMHHTIVKIRPIMGLKCSIIYYISIFIEVKIRPIMGLK